MLYSTFVYANQKPEFKNKDMIYDDDDDWRNTKMDGCKLFYLMENFGKWITKSKKNYEKYDSTDAH